MMEADSKAILEPAFFVSILHDFFRKILLKSAE